MYRSVLNFQLHFSDKEHYLWVPYFCCPSFCWNMLIINMLITSVLTILSSSEHCACKEGGDMKIQSTWTIWWEKPCLTTTDKEEYSRFILPPPPLLWIAAASCISEPPCSGVWCAQPFCIRQSHLGLEGRWRVLPREQFQTIFSQEKKKNSKDCLLWIHTHWICITATGWSWKLILSFLRV